MLVSACFLSFEHWLACVRACVCSDGKFFIPLKFSCVSSSLPPSSSIPTMAYAYQTMTIATEKYHMNGATRVMVMMRDRMLCESKREFGIVRTTGHVRYY